MCNHYLVLHVSNIASFYMVCQVDIEMFWCIYTLTFSMYYGKKINEHRAPKTFSK
jgi:hypothetical protein